MKAFDIFLLFLTYSSLIINLIGVVVLTNHSGLSTISISTDDNSDNNSKYSILYNIFYLITFQFKEIDLNSLMKLALIILKYCYYLSGALLLVSHYKAMTIDPGFINSKNQIAMMNFYFNNRINSIKRGCFMNIYQSKFDKFNNVNIDDVINDSEISEDEASADSFDYIKDVGKPYFPEEWFEDIKEKHDVDFKVKKECSRCFIKRIPYSMHCSQCKG